MNLNFFSILQQVQLTCRQHPLQPILFICISHPECPLKNLLCMDCFDSLPPAHPHHLISFKKFKTIASYFNSPKNQDNEDIIEVNLSLLQTLQMFKDQFNNELDIAQNSVLNNLQSIGKVKDRNKLKEKIGSSATREIWSRMHDQKNSKCQLEAEINAEIDTCTQPITNLIEKINKICDDFGFSEVVRRKRKMKKRRNLFGKVEDKNKKNKRTRKINPEGKQFSEEEKRKIVNRIGRMMPKSRLAKTYNIAYSTLRKWELKYWKCERGARKSSRLWGNREEKQPK